jgi:TolB-like protein/Tfp pilus assembly protein PilF
VDRTSLSELTRRRVPQVLGVTLAAGWGLLEFTDWAVQRFGLPSWLVIVALIAWALVVPLAAWSAWKLGARAAAPRTRTEEPPPRSVAVLPFANGSGDEAAEYLCIGISDEILTALSRIAELRVVARTSSFAYRDAGDDVRAIGRQLGARCILEGSVLVSGDRLRVSTRLVDVRDGYQLWSERYDRAMDDVFRIRDEIAEAVAEALEIVLGDAERRALARPHTRDLQAYEHYVRGREFMLQMRRRTFQYAREMFDRALEIDPDYALAWAGVAETAALQAMFYPAASVDLEDAERASRRSLDLNPALAETHSAHGAVLFMSGRIPEAEEAFRRALEIDPRHADTLYLYARACFQEGRFAEAAERFERAFAVRGDYDSAFFAAQSHEALGDPGTAHEAYERAARAAAEHTDLNPDDPRAATMRAVSLCRIGQVEEGLRWAERALSIDSTDAGVRYNVACLYAQAGRADEAVAHLEEATRAGFGNREWLARDPDLDPIRSDPRFQALLRTGTGSDP